jgi:hypothetical protein
LVEVEERGQESSIIKKSCKLKKEECLYEINLFSDKTKENSQTSFEEKIVIELPYSVR